MTFFLLLLFLLLVLLWRRIRILEGRLREVEKKQAAAEFRTAPESQAMKATWGAVGPAPERGEPAADLRAENPRGQPENPRGQAESSISQAESPVGQAENPRVTPVTEEPGGAGMDAGNREAPMPSEVAGGAREKRFAFEDFLGIRLFAWLGGLVLFLGVTFLIKYSFDNGLISPPLRVGMGLLTGLILLAAGLKLRSRPQQGVTSRALSATGTLILYASIFTAYGLYHLIPAPLAFGLFVLLTVLAFTLAVRIGDTALAVLALGGGFLTPLLVRQGSGDYAALYGYIALLDLGILAVALRRHWPLLPPLAAAGTALWQAGYGLAILTPALAAPLGAIQIGFALLFTAFFYRARARLPDSGLGHLFALAAPLVLFLFFLVFLFDLRLGHRPWLLLSVLFFADLTLSAVLYLSRPLRFLAGLSGAAVFLLLAFWFRGMALSPPGALPAAQVAVLLFSLLHGLLPVLLQRLRPGPRPHLWTSLLPVLALLYLVLPYFLRPAAGALYPALLLLFNGLVIFVIYRMMIGFGASIADWRPSPPRYPAGRKSVLLRLLALRAFDEEEKEAWILSISAVPPFLLLGVLLGRGASLFLLLPLALLLGLLFLETGRRLRFGPLFGTVLFAFFGFLAAGGSALAAVPAYLMGHAFFFLFSAFAGRPRGPAPFLPGAHAAAALSSFGFFLFHYQAFRPFAGASGAGLAAEPAGVLGAAASFFGGAIGLLPLLHALPSLFILGVLSRVTIEKDQGRGPDGGADPNGKHDPDAGWDPDGEWEQDGGRDPDGGHDPGLAERDSDGGHDPGLAKRDAGRARRDALAVHGASSLLLLSLVLPLQFDRDWLLLGWALEGAALTWLNRRIPHPLLPVAAGILFLLVTMRLVLEPSLLPALLPASAWAFLPAALSEALGPSARGLAWPTYVIATGSALLAFRFSAPPHHRPGGLPLRSIFLGLAAFLLFLLVNLLIADYFSPGSREGAGLARAMAYSLAWSVFGLGLLWAGMRTGAPVARLAGLGLLGVVLVKVLLHDLVRLHALYRVGALIGVACILILSSFLYQRQKKGEG